MLKFLIYLILIVIPQVLSYVPCPNGRSCPDSYTCDLSSNSTFCCKDSNCELRSSWSLLKSDCKNRQNYASETHYCNEHLNHSVTKVKNFNATNKSFFRMLLFVTFIWAWNPNWTAVPEVIQLNKDLNNAVIFIWIIIGLQHLRHALLWTVLSHVVVI